MHAKRRDVLTKKTIHNYVSQKLFSGWQLSYLLAVLWAVGNCLVDNCPGSILSWKGTIGIRMMLRCLCSHCLVFHPDLVFLSPSVYLCLIMKNSV